MELTYEERLIKAGKKMHFRKRVWSSLYKVFRVAPVCKVDNKTYAYAATTNKEDVTCMKCLRTMNSVK